MRAAKNLGRFSMTVDACFAILRPGMSRELAYVAMTRGRTDNHAFIATDLPDAGYDGAPAADQTGRQVLAQILASTGAQTSATQTLSALHDDAASLARLAPIHETLVQAAQRRRWQRLVEHCGLSPEQTEHILTSPAYGPLVAALRRAEHDGHPMHRVLPALAAYAPLDVRDPYMRDETEPVRDLAAVLHHGVTTWHEHTTPPPGHRPAPLIGELIAPAGQLGSDVPADQQAAIHQLETLMTTRVKTLTQQAVSNPPRWLRQLGTPPRGPRQPVIWTQAVAAIVTYRDRYTIAEHDHPLGEPSPADSSQRIARQNALAVSRRARAATTPRPSLPPTTRQLTRNSLSL